jgi:hypothetical protein
MEVRANETVRDGVAEDTETAQSAETAVIDARTGRFLELTARQMTAIHLLTMGKSVVATAKSLEIGVSTLHRWKSKQPAFIAELNRRKSEMFEHTVDKLRSTMAKAVDELYAIMQGNNRREKYDLAMHLLPMLQPRKWIVPTGPSDPEAVVDDQIREQRAARGEEPKAEITDEEREAAIAAAEAAVRQTPTTHRHPERSEGPGYSSGDQPQRAGSFGVPQDDGPASDPLEDGSPLPPNGTGGPAKASRSDAFQEEVTRSARTHTEPVSGTLRGPLSRQGLPEVPS